MVSRKFNTIMSFWRKGVSGMAGVMEERLEMQVTQVRLRVQGSGKAFPRP